MNVFNFRYPERTVITDSGGRKKQKNLVCPANLCPAVFREKSSILLSSFAFGWRSIPGGWRAIPALGSTNGGWRLVWEVLTHPEPNFMVVIASNIHVVRAVVMKAGPENARICRKGDHLPRIAVGTAEAMVNPTLDFAWPMLARMPPL